MPTNDPRFLLVDTNCFIRLYGSPVLPLLNQEVGGYQLLTLKSLIDEFLNSPTLPQQYPWVAEEPKVSDLKGASIFLNRLKRRRVEAELKTLAPYAQTFLANYCKNKNTSYVRRLSAKDLELLATATILKALVATDEWPLTLVIKDLMEEPDEYQIGVVNSIDMLHLLESHGRLTPELRRQTVDSWKRLSEKLPRTWQADYQRLFGEPAP